MISVHLGGFSGGEVKREEKEGKIEGKEENNKQKITQFFCGEHKKRNEKQDDFVVKMLFKLGLGRLSRSIVQYIHMVFFSEKCSFGPALQFGGGSRVISECSLRILLDDVPKA